MRSHNLPILFFHFLIISGITLLGNSNNHAADSPIDFEKQVAPILSARCIGCHQPGKAKGGLDLTTLKMALKGGESGPAFELGLNQSSELLSRITPGNPNSKPDMPRQGDPLHAEQIQILNRWIREGAKWPENLILTERSKSDASTWWSLQKLANTKVPKLPESFPINWEINAIDHFIASKLSLIHI